MNKKKFLLMFYFTLLYTSSAFAQTPEWINYTNGDKVYDIVDAGQFLWIATWGGIVKLNKDNDEMTFYNRANSGIPDNDVLSLAMDSSQNLWLGTKYSGIGKLENGNCTVYNMENSELPLDQWNNEIQVDQQGNIWIGSGEYLCIFNGIDWETHFTGSPVSAFTVINDIHFDKEGITWIGASWGLGKLDADTLIENYEGFRNEVSVITTDMENNLWIGTIQNGLFKFDGLNWSVFDTSNSPLPGNNIYDMEFDKNGNLWMATNHGLVRYDGSNWCIYNTSNSGLPEDEIFSLAIDANGIIWLGLINYGLEKFDGTNWQRYNLSNSSLPINQILDIETDNLQSLWFATLAGLSKFDGVSWSLFNNQNSGLKNDYVLSLLSAKDGSLWIGSRGYDCLTNFNGAEWTEFDSTNSILKEEMIESIKEDAEGNIWLATWRGVIKYDGNEWTRYDNTNTPMKSNIISDILFDSEGNLWVGSSTYSFYAGWDGCIAKFTGTEWTTYSTDNSGLPNNSISTLAIDTDDNLWIGTSSGLTKFDGENWLTYNTENSGIIYNQVLDIFVQNKDTIWIAGGMGLSKFVNENQWKNFNVTNSGLGYNYVRTLCEDNFGNLWIGERGISVYREGGIITNINDAYTQSICHEFLLMQNYPNPFNPTTKISFTLPQSSKVSLKVYDMLGREVANLADEVFEAGTYEREFDASNLTSGIYFYTIKTTLGTISKKMLLVK